MSDRRDDPDRPEEAAAKRSEPPTTDQLRDDIDSGRTRDKVAHPDPAAAPLGSDAEAAGAPPLPEEVAMARRHEATRGVPEQPPSSRAASQSGGYGSRIIWLVVAAVVVAIILAFIF